MLMLGPSGFIGVFLGLAILVAFGLQAIGVSSCFQTEPCHCQVQFRADEAQLRALQYFFGSYRRRPTLRFMKSPSQVEVDQGLQLRAP